MGLSPPLLERCAWNLAGGTFGHGRSHCRVPFQLEMQGMDVLILQEVAGAYDEVIKSTKSAAEVMGTEARVSVADSRSCLHACNFHSTSRYELNAFNSSPTSNPGSVAMFGFSEVMRFKRVAPPADCESLIQNPDVSQEPSQLRPKRRAQASAPPSSGSSHSQS